MSVRIYRSVPREGRLGRILHAMAVMLLAAVCTHLAVVLSEPYRSTSDAYDRLSASAAGVRLRSVPLPDGVSPFGDPALPAAYCLYDLRTGPVAVSLTIEGGAFAALSVHGRHGRLPYGLANRATEQQRLDLLLLTTAQAARRGRTASVPPGAPLLVTLDAPEGFVLAQALALSPSQRPGARAVLNGLSCRPSQE